MSYMTDAENRRVDESIGEPRPPLEADVEQLADLSELRQRWSLLPGVPVVAADRTGGIDRSWAGLDIRTLLRGEQSAGRFAVHSMVLAPGAELKPHYHQDAHTIFLVVEGEVELGIGAVVETVGPRSLGYTPPRTRQQIRNNSNSDVALMVVHSPAGAERAFAAAHDKWIATGDEDVAAYSEIMARHGISFDDQPLPNDQKTNQAVPPIEFDIEGAGDLARLRAQFVRRPALPRLVRHDPGALNAEEIGTSRRSELLTGDDNGGFAMVNLLQFSPGRSALPHHQPTEEEFFFIMSGSLQLTCATETTVMGPGGFAFCPRNCTHGFVNESEDETWFATLNSPAGHERAMAAVRRRMARGGKKDELYELSVAGGFIFHSGDAFG